ncbi:MAG: HEPN family nuclease [bacterium]
MGTLPIDLAAQYFIIMDFLSWFVSNLSEDKKSSIYREYCERINITKISGKNILFTPALLLGGMYVLLVFQKEALFPRIPQIAVNDLDVKEWGKINILEWKCVAINQNLKNVIKRMRNAISHANFEIQECGNFLFKNKCPRADDFDFIVEFEFDDLKKFLEQFNMKLHAEWKYT